MRHFLLFFVVLLVFVLGVLPSYIGANDSNVNVDVIQGNNFDPTLRYFGWWFPVFDRGSPRALSYASVFFIPKTDATTFRVTIRYTLGDVDHSASNEIERFLRSPWTSVWFVLAVGEETLEDVRILRVSIQEYNILASTEVDLSR